jgi:anion-transporting  ArsA/GET3 family ATPase
LAGELAILPGLDEVLALMRIKRFYDEGRSMMC